MLTGRFTRNRQVCDGSQRRKRPVAVNIQSGQAHVAIVAVVEGCRRRCAWVRAIGSVMSMRDIPTAMTMYDGRKRNRRCQQHPRC